MATTIRIAQEVRVLQGPRKDQHGIVIEEVRSGWFAVNFGGEDMSKVFCFSSEELEVDEITKRIERVDEKANWPYIS